MRNINLPLFGALLASHGGHFGTIQRGTATDGSEDYALIVAPASAELQDRVWADDYVEIKGAASQHDGQANTAAMAEAGLQLAIDVQAMTLDGHTDWHLPAAAELRALSTTAPELFDKSDWYWSSTLYSSVYAWCQDFEYGYSRTDCKDYEFRARPVRKVHLHALST